jgi:N-acylneuraminate cytidylyltransferase
MAVLGLIAARGGSKGIPRKNLRELGGRPLLTWAIMVARQARLVDTVMVSTDDPEMADLARREGAEVPFLREARLSTDGARQADVALDLLDRLGNAGRTYDVVALLQPTSPFRLPEDVDATIRVRSSEGSDHAFTVSPVVRNHPMHAYRIENGRARPLLDDPAVGVQRQKLSELFERNGAVYVVTAAGLRRSGAFHVAGAPVHVMPAERSVTIDTPLDLAWAEFLVERGIGTLPQGASA